MVESPKGFFSSGTPPIDSICSAMEQEVDVGVRVVHGPAWLWGDQDGGEGYLGTVVEVGEGGRSVLVQWDCGNRCRYRCGEEGK